MKNLHEIIAKIEEPEFDMLYLIHSGFTPVLASLATDAIVKDLIDCLNESPANQDELLRHIKSIMPDYEAGYMHSHDVAITAYLYALDKVGNLEALSQIFQEMRKEHGFFWAKRMALKIYQEKLQRLPEKP